LRLESFRHPENTNFQDFWDQIGTRVHSGGKTFFYFLHCAMYLKNSNINKEERERRRKGVRRYQNFILAHPESSNKYIGACAYIFLVFKLGALYFIFISRKIIFKKTPSQKMPSRAQFRPNYFRHDATMLY
jgi:hypothetical protein